MSHFLVLGSFILLESFSLLADYLIKNASLKPHFSGWIELVLGGIIYGLTAIGWFFLMRELKLVTISLFSALVGLGLTCLLGVFIFREKLSLQDCLGLTFGCISISLLMRFNEG